MDVPATYDPYDAEREGVGAVASASFELAARIREEEAFAIARAQEYARALAAGGDPREAIPGLDWKTRQRSIINPDLGIEAVYRVWNAARGGRNPYLPTEGDFALAEYVAERIGEPVPYARLKNRRGSTMSSSSDRVAVVLLRFEEAGDLVVRRTKLDGKVAFLVRERRDGDPPVGSYRSGSLPYER
jgi:hypothetical protein